MLLQPGPARHLLLRCSACRSHQITALHDIAYISKSIWSVLMAGFLRPRCTIASRVLPCRLCGWDNVFDFVAEWPRYRHLAYP